eukprot:7292963-Prymnesium_polylepis.1
MGICTAIASLLMRTASAGGHIMAIDRVGKRAPRVRIPSGLFRTTKLPRKFDKSDAAHTLAKPHLKSLNRLFFKPLPAPSLDPSSSRRSSASS